MNVNDVSISQVKVEFFPYLNRVPLKFGHEVSNGGELVCVRMQVTDTKGRSAWGYGETPLGAAWSWPSVLSQSRRVERMQAFCLLLQEEWGKVFLSGHPMEIGSLFLETRLTDCLKKENAAYPSEEPMPYLCALVCCSAFDLALYDAYGILHGVKVFDCLNGRYMNRDLSTYYSPEYAGLFAGKYPEEYLVPRNAVPARLAACHLVGGKDHLYPSELTEEDPKDEYPLLLQDWIHRDGLFNLKIKLTGNDAPWDYNRIVEVGRIAIANAVQNLTVDFNCTVTDPAYVNEILDKLKAQEPAIYEMILYVEQPFPYDMEANPIDVHACSRRKLLLMDESAHDWRLVALGYKLGWTGVALKTCKTLTGALLSLCWAREHGMAIMVQDLTNPRLAIIPHVLLAANAGTIMGVEVNSMQFCPGASADAARIHPGLYRRREGCVSFYTLGDSGFGYRLEEIERAAREAYHA